MILPDRARSPSSPSTTGLAEVSEEKVVSVARANDASVVVVLIFDKFDLR